MPDRWTPLRGGKAVQLYELSAVAKDLLRAAEGRKVWLFFGDMGAGKTTLIKAICEVLGAGPGMSSPTFSIVNEYAAGSSKIFHFDFYRIRNLAEALDIGVEEYFDSGNYCFIEWPEKIESLIPTERFKIKISNLNDNARTIEYQQ